MRTKLCKDCKYVDKTEAYDATYWKCNAPQNLLPVGDSTRRWIYCDTMRKEGFLFSWLTNMCGKSGRWFEPKEKTN